MSVPTIDPRVAAAQLRATAARARLEATVQALKQRTSPQALAQEAAETLKDKSIAVAQDLAEAAARRPAVAAAVAGGLVLFLLRHRVAALAHRATGASPRRSSSKSNSKKGPAR